MNVEKEKLGARRFTKVFFYFFFSETDQKNGPFSFTCAPRAIRVSTRTAVCALIWVQPTILAPVKGLSSYIKEEGSFMVSQEGFTK